MLKLEAGKRYWRRDGGVSGPLIKADIDHPAFRFNDGLNRWYEDGVYLWGREESEFDLVREYTEPQPLEWKRGIPTEEECRECWIVTGRRGNVPNSEGVVFAPGEVKDANRLFNVAEGQYWYLALKVKPVEPPKPKTRTVTQRKYTKKFGEEMWTDQPVFRASGWIDTDQTRTVEVPCE